MGFLTKPPKSLMAVVLASAMALACGCGGASGGGTSTAAHLDKAQSLIEAGNFEEAYAHLNRALAMDPQDPDVHHNLGWLYIYKDEPEKATAELHALEAVAPDSAATYHLRGGIFSHLDRQEEAVENYRKAITLDKEEEKTDLAHGVNPRLYFDLASSLSAMQDHKRALKTLQEGFQHTPGVDVAGRVNFQVAICSEYYNLKDYAKAYKHCEAALDQTDDPQQKEQITDFVENMKLAESLEKADVETGEYQEPTGSD